MPGWKALGWRRKVGKRRLVPVENEDLWRSLDQLWTTAPPRHLAIRWVKGHANHKHVEDGLATELDAWGNNQADRLARTAAHRAQPALPGTHTGQKDRKECTNWRFSYSSYKMSGRSASPRHRSESRRRARSGGEGGSGSDDTPAQPPAYNGVVTRWLGKFGFAAREGAPDIFVPAPECGEVDGVLKKGDAICFTVGTDPKGRECATKVQRVAVNVPVPRGPEKAREQDHASGGGRITGKLAKWRGSFGILKDSDKCGGKETMLHKNALGGQRGVDGSTYSYRVRCEGDRREAYDVKGPRQQFRGGRMHDGPGDVTISGRQSGGARGRDGATARVRRAVHYTKDDVRGGGVVDRPKPTKRAVVPAVRAAPRAGRGGKPPGIDRQRARDGMLYVFQGLVPGAEEECPEDLSEE
eukprot:gene5833-14695_t